MLGSTKIQALAQYRAGPLFALGRASVCIRCCFLFCPSHRLPWLDPSLAQPGYVAISCPSCNY